MKVNIRSVFKISRNVNSFWNLHSTFLFFTSSSSKQYSFLTFHFSKFDENPFYFLLVDIFPFFFLWILFSFLFLFLHKPPHWNKLIKFHLETLWIRALRKKGQLKSLNRVTSDNVSRKKKKKTYMAQSRQKWPNLISQRLV